MKVNELMIGDWVEWNNIPSRVHTITSAEQIRLSNSKVLTELRYSYEINFKPIPLTTEILEKNDFELQEQEQDFFNGLYSFKHYLLYVEPYSSDIKDGYIVGGSITNYDHFNVHTRMLSSFCKVYYVHELQHILRLCGLWDFANSFKI